MYCRSYGVMFIKFFDIDWLFFGVILTLVCSLRACHHVINQESYIYSWNLGKIYLVHFLKFWNLTRFTWEISKFQKSKLGKFISNFPLKHVITSTNDLINSGHQPARHEKYQPQGSNCVFSVALFHGSFRNLVPSNIKKGGKDIPWSIELIIFCTTFVRYLTLRED